MGCLAGNLCPTIALRARRVLLFCAGSACVSGRSTFEYSREAGLITKPRAKQGFSFVGSPGSEADRRYLSGLNAYANPILPDCMDCSTASSANRPDYLRQRCKLILRPSGVELDVAILGSYPPVGGESSFQPHASRWAIRPERFVRLVEAIVRQVASLELSKGPTA